MSNIQPITEQTSSRAVNAAIKAVSKTAGAYNAAVQTAIVLIIRHAATFGDCTGAERLMNAMPRSNRRSLVIAHFADFSPISVRKDGEIFKANFRKESDTKFKKFNPEGAEALNWWERPEAAKLPDVINLMAVRDDFDKFIERERNKAKKVRDEVKDLADDDATKVNRLRDADEIEAFVNRIVAAVKSAVEPVTNASNGDAGVPAVQKAA